jgi:hypothetical protein
MCLYYDVSNLKKVWLTIIVQTEESHPTQQQTVLKIMSTILILDVQGV